MKTQYYTACSLDGFIADPDHSLEWLFQLGALEDTSYPAFIAEIGALAMGSHTYEWLLRHEVRPDADPPKPWPYTIPAWVFTTRELPVVPGANVRFVRGDVRPVHRDMVEAANGRNVWIAGGGDLVGQFYDQGLLDEIWVQFGSVTLGAGFPLLSARACGTGFAELRYEVVRAEISPSPNAST